MPSVSAPSETVPGVPDVWVSVSTSPVSPGDTVPSTVTWPCSTTTGAAVVIEGPASSVTVAVALATAAPYWSVMP